MFVRKNVSLPLTADEWEKLSLIAKKEERFLNRQAAWFVREAIRKWKPDRQKTK